MELNENKKEMEKKKRERERKSFFGLCDDSEQKFNINKVFRQFSRSINFKTNETERVYIVYTSIQYTFMYVYYVSGMLSVVRMRNSIEFKLVKYTLWLHVIAAQSWTLILTIK